MARSAGAIGEASAASAWPLPPSCSAPLPFVPGGGSDGKGGGEGVGLRGGRHVSRGRFGEAEKGRESSREAGTDGFGHGLGNLPLQLLHAPRAADRKPRLLFTAHLPLPFVAHTHLRRPQRSLVPPWGDAHAVQPPVPRNVPPAARVPRGRCVGAACAVAGAGAACPWEPVVKLGVARNGEDAGGIRANIKPRPRRPKLGCVKPGGIGGRRGGGRERSGKS